MDGRLAGKRQGPQGLPGELKEDEPGRGPGEGPEDEGRCVGNLYSAIEQASVGPLLDNLRIAYNTASSQAMA